MFWFVGKEIGSFELYIQKSSDLVFPRKLRCFKLYNTENMFWLVGTKIGFFELYIANASDFAFCLLKHVALTQRFVCRKNVLLSALLHGKKVFFPVCSESPCLSLDFTQKNVFSCHWLSDNGLLVYGQVTLFSPSSL